MSQLDDLANRDLAEEIDAINAIYEPETIKLDRAAAPAPTPESSQFSDTAQTTVTLQIPGQPHLSFILGFEAKYPEARPVILGTASTAARGEGKIAVDVLEDIVQRNWQPGAVCLFDVISEAVEAFPELSIGGGNDGDNKEESTKKNGQSSSQEAGPEKDTEAVARTAEDFARISLRDAFGLDDPPVWILSDPISEKKSVFLGRAVRVANLTQAQACLEHLTTTDKKAAVATHNISAWRIKQRKEGTKDAAETQIQDYDDDGETAAGGRLLHVMQLMDVWNVLVVVSRWYGGVQLGPARFKLINDAGRDALVKGQFVEEAPANSEKGKKKGKK